MTPAATLRCVTPLQSRRQHLSGGEDARSWGGRDLLALVDSRPMPRRRHQPRPGIGQPAPPSLMWATRADGRLIECLARLFVSGIYVEVRIEGAPMLGRTFPTSGDAIAFSEQQRQLWEEPHHAG